MTESADSDDLDLELDLEVLKEIIPSSKDMIDMIQKDVVKLKRHVPNHSWSSTGVFIRVMKDMTVYVYQHTSHLPCSSLSFHHVNCFNVVSVNEELMPYQECTVCPHHDELEPYLLDNRALVQYFEEALHQGRNDVKENLETVKKVMSNHELSKGTIFVCPPRRCNNWDENHWTKRLAEGIQKKHPDVRVLYSAEMGNDFEGVLSFLKCPTMNKRFFLFRGAPDILLKHSRAMFAGTVENPEPQDSFSSEDEIIENVHQRPPLKGYGNDDPPAKLGEVVAGLHMMLTSKILKNIVKGKDVTEKEFAVKGLLLDKMYILYQTSLEVKYSAAGKGELKLILQDYSGHNLTTKGLCFQINTLMS